MPLQGSLLPRQIQHLILMGNLRWFLLCFDILQLLQNRILLYWMVDCGVLWSQYDAHTHTNTDVWYGHCVDETTIIKRCMLTVGSIWYLIVAASFVHTQQQMPIFILIMANNIIVFIVQCFDFVWSVQANFSMTLYFMHISMCRMWTMPSNWEETEGYFPEVFFFDALFWVDNAPKGGYLLVNTWRKDTNNSSQRDGDCHLMVVK